MKCVNDGLKFAQYFWEVIRVGECVMWNGSFYLSLAWLDMEKLDIGGALFMVL